MKLTQEGLLEHSKYPIPIITKHTNILKIGFIITNICYCSGYMSPEYAMEGLISENQTFLVWGLYF